jgi:hypothetical protein
VLLFNTLSRFGTTDKFVVGRMFKKATFCLCMESYSKMLNSLSY